MNNKIWSYFFLVLFVICTLFFLENVLFIFIKKKAVVSNIQVEKLDDFESRLTFSYLNEQKKIDIDKIKENSIIDDFLNFKEPFIYYCPINKYHIQLSNEKKSFLDFFIFLVGMLMFFISFKYYKNPSSSKSVTSQSGKQ